MSKISNCFKALQASHKKALIPFITAGDTSTEITLPLMHAMVESGANILELGVPFSDPMADGPIIQKASERALANGINLEKVFQMVSDFRQKDSQTPIVLMGYLNPIEKMGYKTFAKKAADCGVDGVLTVDLPPEESAGFCQELSNNQLDPIFLIAPTSKPERIKTICEVASGFVYYVSVKGVTGASNLNTDSVAEKLTTIRQSTQLPVGVGFGISDAKSAKQVGALSDAVIVGSALIKIIVENENNQNEAISQVKMLINSMRCALDELP